MIPYRTLDWNWTDPAHSLHDLYEEEAIAEVESIMQPESTWCVTLMLIREQIAKRMAVQAR